MAKSSIDSTACLWDLRSIGAKKPKTLKTLNHARAVHSAYFSPSGLSLATTSSLEYKNKHVSTGITLKPKQEFVAKLASQIISEERGNAAPATRMSMTRRVHPLVSLNLLFRADNPGVWFFHCHLEVHTSWGLKMAFLVEDGKGSNEKLPPPPSDLPSC